MIYKSTILDIYESKKIAESIKINGIYSISSSDEKNSKFINTVNDLVNKNFIQIIDKEIFITKEGKINWSHYNE